MRLPDVQQSAVIKAMPDGNEAYRLAQAHGRHRRMTGDADAIRARLRRARPRRRRSRISGRNDVKALKARCRLLSENSISHLEHRRLLYETRGERFYHAGEFVADLHREVMRALVMISADYASGDFSTTMPLRRRRLSDAFTVWRQDGWSREHSANRNRQYFITGGPRKISLYLC